MVGGLGIIIIFIMIIRHVGACVREGHQNSYLKNHAIQNGFDTYYNANGNEVLLNNGHRCYSFLDNEFGVERTDTVTGEKIYPQVQELCNKYFAEKNQSHEGTVWKGRMEGVAQIHPVYIEYATDRMMRKARIHPAGKYSCEFYTDFWTRSKVLRKTDAQIAEDERLRAVGLADKIVTLSEIEQGLGQDSLSYDKYNCKWKIATPLSINEF